MSVPVTPGRGSVGGIIEDAIGGAAADNAVPMLPYIWAAIKLVGVVISEVKQMTGFLT